MPSPSIDSLTERLASEDYLRQRLSPQPGDPLYLHLQDLRQALERHRTNEPLCVLDYGSGGSPYRSLFPAATYHRADFPPAQDVDYLLSEQGLLPAIADSSYDLVLSTQVLEHVREPQAYLAEAKRLLRPGGRLLLSTHGTFPDHGCPHDYWRWTADGLRLSLSQSGLRIESLQRLTCGIRSILFWAGQMFHVMPAPKLTPGSIALRLFHRLVRDQRARVDRLIDHRTRASACLESRSPEPVDLCVALLAVAAKPR